MATAPTRYLRIAVLVNAAQKAEIELKAGRSPLSGWIKRQILGPTPERVKALLRSCPEGELEAVLGAIHEVLAEEKK